jgi:8-oxo-dGTP pyrophosphatase MutT (NUDIX family)
MTAKNLRPWKTRARRTILDHSRFLKVESHTIELPDGEVIEDWPWVIIPSAAIVLAMTDDERFVCFRQVKYAVDGITLAPVGGMIEPGEEPLRAAKRELLEETGYAAGDWVNLGSYVVDPNRGGAHMHLFLALHAENIASPNSDDLEDQELIFLRKDELERAVLNGEFKVLAWAAAASLALNYLTQGAPRAPSGARM